MGKNPVRTIIQGWIHCFLLLCLLKNKKFEFLCWDHKSSRLTYLIFQVIRKRFHFSSSGIVIFLMSATSPIYPSITYNLQSKFSITRLNVHRENSAFWGFFIQESKKFERFEFHITPFWSVKSDFETLSSHLSLSLSLGKEVENMMSERRRRRLSIKDKVSSLSLSLIGFFCWNFFF